MEPNARVMRLDPSMEDAIRNDRCYLGGEQVYVNIKSWMEAAEGPGHIYSEAGLKEYKNSGTCEFHFDQAFDVPELTEEDLDRLADEHSGMIEDDEPMTPEEEEMAPQDEKIL
jgi:hypothetical protein